MADALIAVTDDGAIRTVTVQRPDKLNALNAATLQALAEAFSAAAADPEIRVVVLTGAGPKAFVAGADIAEMNTLSAVQGRDFSLLGQALMRQIERLPPAHCRRYRQSRPTGNQSRADSRLRRQPAPAAPVRPRRHPGAMPAGCTDQCRACAGTGDRQRGGTGRRAGQPRAGHRPAAGTLGAAGPARPARCGARGRRMQPGSRAVIRKRTVRPAVRHRGHARGNQRLPAAPPAGLPEPLTPWHPDPTPRSCLPGSRQTISTAPCRPG